MTVSKGPENVTVPDVNGKSEEEAKKALEDLGLKAEINKRLGGPFGTARSTDPAAGTSVKAGSSVKIQHLLSSGLQAHRKTTPPPDRRP